MSTTSPAAIEQELAQLVVEIGQNLTSTYIGLSAICLLVYDVMINLDREIEFIWRTRWSISKVLFIIARYYGLCYITVQFAVTTTVGLSLEFCRGYFWYIEMAGDIFFTSIVNIILIMRLYALYGNRRVLVVFIFLFLCEFAFELYACIKSGIETSNTAFTIPAGIPLPGCFASPDTKIAISAWVPCMVIATAFFAMTVAKVAAQGYSTPKRLMDIKHISPLVVLMVRDGALYYCLMFVILLVSIIYLETTQGFIASAPLPWVVAVYSLTASHLVLNLREAGSRTHFGLTTSDSMTLRAPVFAMRPVRRTGWDTEMSYDADGEYPPVQSGSGTTHT